MDYAEIVRKKNISHRFVSSLSAAINFRELVRCFSNNTSNQIYFLLQKQK